ncbi:MAG: HAMP domain-containing histidine kinase [bacterium]|nr:HAMP domain-containing histidine kinase [bacterium]
MRIQARLFLGTTILVLSLMAVQWWVHVRQVRAIQNELGSIATSVGRHFLMADFGVPHGFSFRAEHEENDDSKRTVIRRRIKNDVISSGGDERCDEDDRVEVMVVAGAGEHVIHEVESSWTRILSDGTSARVESMETFVVPLRESEIEFVGEEAFTWVETEGSDEQKKLINFNGEGAQVRRIEMRVVRPDEGPDRFLVVSDDQSVDAEIPIPVSPTVRAFQTALGHGLSVSVGLLVIGIVASAVMANRLARPLRDLAEGVDAIGKGEFGTEVPVTAVGEIGELQGAFNSMSTRLADLERQRDEWQQKEHLAELGDLARGLAHTVRNPLNTLGLAVEELGSGEGDRDQLVVTSRSQIRRIDRWLRSFLAVGASGAAQRQATALGTLVQSVVLEAVQQGARVDLTVTDEDTTSLVVPDAVRAAVANLVENAVEASPDNTPVEVSVESDAESVRVRVADRGPGLSEEVQARLFSPHVSTKIGGSGMGLFLSRQLISGMHQGELEVDERQGGGTVATMQLRRFSQDSPDENGEPG